VGVVVEIVETVDGKVGRALVEVVVGGGVGVELVEVLRRRVDVEGVEVGRGLLDDEVVEATGVEVGMGIVEEVVEGGAEVVVVEEVAVELVVGVVVLEVVEVSTGVLDSVDVEVEVEDATSELEMIGGAVTPLIITKINIAQLLNIIEAQNLAISP